MHACQSELRQVSIEQCPSADTYERTGKSLRDPGSVGRWPTYGEPSSGTWMQQARTEYAPVEMRRAG